VEVIVAERISESEHAVMDILWRTAPLTATQVGDALAGSRRWSAQTVKTLLARLVTKGAVATQQDGRRYLYSPLMARDDHDAHESQRLVDRLFGGRISPLVAQALSANDIAEIEALLESLKS
jgi:BlaI family transcriptional regulator, penicillinase repressor